ncbi:CCA tRNA nucleotidyltransferase [Patescibacteria group bacterium]|nr:CCA tRNA nucleotidyltransferase [Patescibacteria group bacterium]
MAYLVGGGVRDVLLGRRPKDFDVSTDARPNQVHRLFRNSRVIGRRFRLVQVFFRGGKVVEVSTFRKSADVEADDDAVLQANNTFGTPAEDALRRDLTINALFYNIADYSLVDYVDGLKDLKAGLIRSVGEADLRFHRDPVRVLRAVRHAARIGFKLTDDTLEAVQKRREELSLCPSSRVRDELMRDLKGGSSAPWLELAHKTGVLYSLLPGLEPFYGDDDSPLRRAAVKLLKRVDDLIAGGAPPSDPVLVASLFWPALEEKALEEEFPPGRAGRSRWAFYVRETLPRMAKSVQFAKRVMERACQIGAVMGFFREENPPPRLPKKVTEKGYFVDACQLAEVLGRDLASHAEGASSKPGRKRRRKRRKKKPGAGANAPAK